MRQATQRRSLSPRRPPLRFDWSKTLAMIDGEFRRVYRARLGSYIAYALKDGGAWRWMITFEGTTIFDGIKSTLIDAKHSAENAYGPTRNPQMTLSEATQNARQGDGSGLPF